MEYAIFKALLFVVALLDGVYLGVLAHGLGHAIMALILTRQSVIVKVGTLGEVVGLSMGRLTLKLGLKGFRYGSTSYDRQSESVSRQRLIILGGPLVTLFLTIAFGSSLARFDPWGWIWVALMGFFVANLRILTVSLWPIAYQAPDGSGEVWKSDMLDLLSLGKR